MNFIDFVKSMVKKPVVDYSVDDVKAAFKLLAKSDEQKEAGKISSKSLADQLMHLGLPGEQLSKDKVDEILGITETDSTGEAWGNWKKGDAVGNSLLELFTSSPCRYD